MVPIVVFDQVYSFDRDALITAIPRPEKMAEKQFGAAAREVLDRLLQMTDNAGATDEQPKEVRRCFADRLHHLAQG